MTNDLWEQQIALTSPPAGARILTARFDPLDPPEVCFHEEGLKRQPMGLGPSFEFIGQRLGIKTVVADRTSTGLLVEDVAAKSPFRSGDWLTTVDGQRIIGFEHFRELMLKGTRLGFVRNGVTLQAEVSLPRLTEAELWPLQRERWVQPQVAK